MKKGWEIKKLDDVCDLITCGVAARPNYVNDGIPFLSAKNIKEGKIIWSGFNYISDSTHKELTKNNKPLLGDILYTRVGSYGEAAVIEEKREFSIFVSLTLIKVDKSVLNNYFLKHYLNSDFVKQLAKKSISGSGVGNLNVGTVRGFPISIPPLSEQKQIVAILDKAFSDIAKVKENAEKNLQNAKDLFESYLQSVFSNKGDGWEVKKLGAVCKVIAGQSPEGKYYNKDKQGLPFYQGKKEYGEKYIGKPTTWTTKVTKEAEKDDILMSVRAPVGPINFATQKICIGRGLASIRATKLIHRDFLYNFLLKYENEIVGNTGAVFNSINKAQIEAIEIPLPSISEQEEIIKKIDSLSVETKRLENVYQQKINDLEELKKSILQKAFNGELNNVKV